jgi:hypothetical protein
MKEVAEYNYKKALDIVRTEKHSKHVAFYYNEIIDRARTKAYEL